MSEVLIVILTTIGVLILLNVIIVLSMVILGVIRKTPGRPYTEEELEEFNEFCKEYNEKHKNKCRK